MRHLIHFTLFCTVLAGCFEDGPSTSPSHQKSTGVDIKWSYGWAWEEHGGALESTGTTFGFASTTFQEPFFLTLSSRQPTCSVEVQMWELPADGATSLTSPVWTHVQTWHPADGVPIRLEKVWDRPGQVTVSTETAGCVLEVSPAPPVETSRRGHG